MRASPTDNPRSRIPVGLGLLVVVVLTPSAAGAAPPLEDDGERPGADRRSELVDAVCGLDAAAPVCDCQQDAEKSTAVRRVRSGAFTAPNRNERLAALRGCGHHGTALLRRAGDGDWRAIRFFPRVRTERCLTFQRDGRPDLLACHRALSEKHWRVGWIYTLDFATRPPRRRQLTSYRSNARGCPTGRLRTTHPVEWRRWQVADDPRSPLLTVRLQHRNADVPDEYGDACEAMREGDPVFGPRRIRTEYFALRAGRFAFSGATTATVPSRAPRAPGEAANETSPSDAEPEWSTERRREAPVCRRADARANVREHRPALTDCYREALRRDREARGSLEVRWKIGETGDVQSVEFVNDEIDDDQFAECVASVVRTFESPPPRGLDTCTFVYPLEFAPASSTSSSSDPSSAPRTQESP